MKIIFKTTAIKFLSTNIYLTFLRKNKFRNFDNFGNYTAYYIVKILPF